MAAGAKAGANYVPYRNSKLTRLLKDGLSGNSRTAMITTVAAANDQYHHSINTLNRTAVINTVGAARVPPVPPLQRHAQVKRQSVLMLMINATTPSNHPRKAAACADIDAASDSVVVPT
eukprot:scaffold77320_cov22-Tisochrysis_lutea.AAC.4